MFNASVAQRDYLLVPMTVKRLGNVTRRDWEDATCDDFKPATFDQFQKFLECRLRTLDCVQRSSNFSRNFQNKDNSQGPKDNINTNNSKYISFEAHNANKDNSNKIPITGIGDAVSMTRGVVTMVITHSYMNLAINLQTIIHHLSQQPTPIRLMLKISLLLFLLQLLLTCPHFLLFYYGLQQSLFLQVKVNMRMLVLSSIFVPKLHSLLKVVYTVWSLRSFHDTV